MSMRIIIISLCFVLIAPTQSAGTKEATDCNKIDEKKFKELFKFKYGGGAKGLYLDFGFEPKEKNTFKVENCDFLLKENQISHKGKALNKQKDPKKLNSLKPCLKYDVKLKIQNTATKKDFNYEDAVYTKLDSAVTKLSLTVEQNKNDSATRLSWNNLLTDASCITNFEVAVKDADNKSVFEDVNVKTASAVLPDLPACQTYSAQVTAKSARDEKVVSPAKAFFVKAKGKSIKRLDLTIGEVKMDSVALTWSSEPENCQQEYKVKLRDLSNKVVYEKTFLRNSTVITNLTSCNNYSVELIALDDDNVALAAVIKSFYIRSMPIENVKISVSKSKTRATVSWSIPNTECITDFHVNYAIEDCDNSIHGGNVSCSYSQTVNKTEDKTNSFRLESLPLAERFLLTVYANEITSSDASRAKTWTFNTIDYDKFVVHNIKEFRNKRTELRLSWSFEVSLMKHVKQFEVSYDGKMLTTNKTSIALSIAACYKNYAISVQCISADGFKGAIVTYDTNLNDDELSLSPVEDFQFEQINDSMIISWTPRGDEVSCIKQYEIDFVDESFIANDTRLSMNDNLVPCISYEITITPISLSGQKGLQSTFEFTSKEFFPQPPTKLKLVDSDNKDLRISTSISDNDKHCDSTRIEFTCDNITAVLNVESAKTEYLAKLTGFSPFTTYNCSARVRNNLGVSESTDVEAFQTKQDAPQAPKDISVVVNDDNSVTVEWIPETSTGVASGFNVKVKFETTNYFINSNCAYVLRKKFVKQTSDSKVKFDNLEPFSSYSVVITSTNSFGSSEPSPKHSFMTKSSKPSAPQDILIEFIPGEEPSNISAILNWSAPCKLNGVFSLYLISLKGVREGFEEHSIVESTSYQSFEIKDLKRGYHYEVKLQAKNAEHVGEFEPFSFVAPSGIPLESDLISWTNFSKDELSLSNGRVDIFLRRRIFISSVGDITGIAFLLFLANCPDLRQPSSGYFESNNFTLPSTHEVNNLECFELYQQTEVLANPLSHSREIVDGRLDDYSVKFTLGDEICLNSSGAPEYCNGELALNTQYGVMARVFTKDGFRDTEPVYIEIKVNPLKLVPSEIYVYSSVGFMMVMSLAILLCCCVRNMQKKKELEREKQAAAESDENLLSFTSYCVIDKNPLPRKKNYDD